MNSIPTDARCAAASLPSPAFTAAIVTPPLKAASASGPFSQLTPEQLNFHDHLRALRRQDHPHGRRDRPVLPHHPQPVARSDPRPGLSSRAAEKKSGGFEGDRQRILEDLDAGRISADEAMRLLKEMEA